MRDYLDGIRRLKVITGAFVDGQSDPKEYYLKLASALLEKDKVIADRYDDLRGSNYFMRLIMLVEAGVISMEECKDLDDELKVKLSFFSRTPSQTDTPES